MRSKVRQVSIGDSVWVSDLGQSLEPHGYDDHRRCK